MKIKKFNEELMLWDDGNMKALKTYAGDRYKKTHTIEITEPKTFEVKDSDDFYKLKYLLMAYKVPHNITENKI